MSKSVVQRVLDQYAEDEVLTKKEWGKSKVYVIKQEGLPVRWLVVPCVCVCVCVCMQVRVSPAILST